MTGIVWTTTLVAFTVAVVVIVRTSQKIKERLILRGGGSVGFCITKVKLHPLEPVETLLVHSVQLADEFMRNETSGMMEFVDKVPSMSFRGNLLHARIAGIGLVGYQTTVTGESLEITVKRRFWRDPGSCFIHSL